MAEKRVIILITLAALLVAALACSPSRPAGVREEGKKATAPATEGTPATGKKAPPLKTFTAKEGYPLAEQKAREWSPNARLYQVKAYDEVKLNGKAAAWAYYFADPEMGKSYVVVIREGKVSGTDQRGWSRMECPEIGDATDWAIDSPEAIRTAEENGGKQCREEGSPLLNPKLYFCNPPIEWEVYYLGCYRFLINATTGEVMLKEK